MNSYNSSGNPLNYLNYTVTYKERNIASLAKGTNKYNYLYNADGIRISKDVNGLVTNFTLDGNKIIDEKRSGVTLKYYYDISDQLVGFTYNDQIYVYLKNVQNDIIGIANANGDILVKYFYDAYGNTNKVIDVSGINLANINPFRYRSYYFDNETGFYYLNSRFYNPLLGRFINADDVSYLGVTQDFVSFNLYAYCGNNPVNKIDSNGKFAISIIAGLVVAGVMAHGAKKAYDTAKDLGSTGWELAGYTASGVIMGDYLPVKDNWDIISKDIDSGYIEERDIINFSFTDNKYYSIYTAGLYSDYLYENYPVRERTERGMYIELQAHYVFDKIARPFGITNGNPAMLGIPGFDLTAALSEVMANPFNRPWIMPNPLPW